MGLMPAYQLAHNKPVNISCVYPNYIFHYIHSFTCARVIFNISKINNSLIMFITSFYGSLLLLYTVLSNEAKTKQVGSNCCGIKILEG